ncbi:hypothetical protein OIU74_029500, partial [Salix koriyanagi]
MVFVEENPVVVHTSGITTTTWMLPVLTDSSMAGTNVASLLAVLLEAGCHWLWVVEGMSGGEMFLKSDES